MTVRPRMSAQEIGFFADPLKDWANDDLLIKDEARGHFRRHEPDAFQLLDWPELRKSFLKCEETAQRMKKRAQQQGVLAVCLMTAGLLMTAFAQALTGANVIDPFWAGLSASSLIIAGAYLAFEHFVRGKAKNSWLAARFKAERTRQLYFQFLIQHIDLACQAMGDGTALENYKTLRARKLSEFETIFMASVRPAMEHLRQDSANADPWIDPAWRVAPSVVGLGPAFDDLCRILQNQRFGIQRRYTQLNLEHSIQSPQWRAKITTGLADCLTLLLPVTALLICIALFAGYGSADRLLVWLVAIQAGSAAIVASLRVFDEGMRWGDDARRYFWYLAETEETERKFLSAGPQGKLEALREMERVSYEELRWFLQTQERSRFLI